MIAEATATVLAPAAAAAGAVLASCRCLPPFPPFFLRKHLEHLHHSAPRTLYVRQPISQPQPPSPANRRQISPAAAVETAALPETAAPIAARAVAAAFLALPLLRPLPTCPTRVVFRKFLLIVFLPPKATLLVLKP